MFKNMLFVILISVSAPLFACNETYVKYITKTCGVANSSFVVEIVIPNGRSTPFFIDVQPPDTKDLGFKSCVVLNSMKYEFPKNTLECKQKFPI